MKKLILILTLIVSFSLSAFAKNNFVPGISDLPAPINFNLVDGSNSVFNGETGRIVEATFRGIGKKHKIMEFYDKTLAGLGWHRQGKLHYTREGEELIITTKYIVEDEKFNTLEIHYSLIPR